MGNLLLIMSVVLAVLKLSSVIAITWLQVFIPVLILVFLWVITVLVSMAALWWVGTRK